MQMKHHDGFFMGSVRGFRNATKIVKSLYIEILTWFHLFSVQIVAQLKRWAEDSPVAKWIDITDGNLTTMENPIHMIIVDDPSNGQIMSAKQIVMIVAGA